MDPVTALTIASTAISAVGAISSAQAQSNAAKYNAQVAKNNAQIARDQAASESDRQRRLATKKLGEMRANYAASGVTMEGTPLDVMEESAAQAKLDELTIRYNGELQAMGFENTANLDRYRASQAMTSGYLSAGSALLTGGTKLYDMKIKTPPKG